MSSPLDRELRYLKGIGEKREKFFNKKGITTVGGLLSYYPRSYENWSDIYSIAEAPSDKNVCIKATVTANIFTHSSSSGISVSRSAATDGECAVSLIFFNNPYIKETVKRGEELLFYGRIKANPDGTREMLSPAVMKPSEGGCLHPVYAQSGELTSRMISRAVKSALELCKGNIPETLPEEQIKKFRLEKAEEALRKIHFPKNEDEIAAARRRLIFEELLVLQLGLLSMRKKVKEKNRFYIENDFSEEFAARLPFSLTRAQTEAIRQCVSDMQSASPMQRLLQGDVGSGKTAVAASLIYTAAKNGFQSVLMAPTEVLAEQHFVTFSRFFEGTDIRLALLTGSTTAKNKKLIKEALAEGTTDVLIGTHAVITDDVVFSSLALAITDEQHRFGVRQRAKLRDKSMSPHVLVMSATPIPRTLSLIIYGELDISVLDEKPLGRKEIKTYRVGSDYHQRLYSFMKKEVAAGHQCYIVCPLAEDSEENTTDRISAEKYVKELSHNVFPELKTALLHGKMKPSEKDAIMQSFKNGEIDILICTVVIEVGIDVPNATVMIIENAECFGLSQLHQLRGRVGRGDAQSYCVLVSDSHSDNTDERLNVLCRTNDGFVVADEDLKLRGPGDFFGSRQSGLPQLQIADLTGDSKILFAARSEAQRIMASDPQLSHPENRFFKEKIKALFSDIS